MKNTTKRTDGICCLGKSHDCLCLVNDGYCCAEECQFLVFPMILDKTENEDYEINQSEKG